MENEEILVNEEDENVENEPEIVQVESDFPCGIGYALAGVVLGAVGIVGTRLIGKALKPVAIRAKEKIKTTFGRKHRKDEPVDADWEDVSDEENSEN